MSDGFAGFEYYHYDPSMAAAVIFIIGFLLSTILHTYQMIRTKTWFLIPLIIGGHCEWLGYVGRAISSTQTPNWTMGPYIMQTLLCLVAPALFAASIYMTLGRIIRLVDGEHHSLIRLKWLTKIFVAGDIISFITQGAGGGLQSAGSSDPSIVKTGSNVIVGGLVIQLVIFAFFVITAVLFHTRMRSAPTAVSYSVPWERHMFTLYAASTLIMIRSIFRIIEYAQGFTGYLLEHEVYLYIFDATLMLAVVLIFNVVHPSEVQALLRGGRAIKRGVAVEEVYKRDLNVQLTEV